MSDEFKDKLSPEQYYVCRLGGTEAPFSGKYNDFFEDGTYHCAACGNELFDSKTKFNSGSGWPSFYDVLSQANLRLVDDSSHGMRRIEVRCAKCDSHLGHVFTDGPKDKGGLRYCINSLAIKFIPKSQMEEMGYGYLLAYV